MNKSYTGLFTIFVFVLLTSSVVPVVAINKDTKEIAATTVVKTASPSAATKTVLASPSAVPKSASSSAAPKSTPSATSDKTVVLTGEMSATPSAIGKFLFKTKEGDKNGETDKKTKILSFEKAARTTILLNKIKISDRIAVIGTTPSPQEPILAKYIFVLPKEPIASPSKATYGTVTSKDATDTTTFTIKVKGAAKDSEEKQYTINSNSVIKVKEIDSPRINDIKIGDRVTLTYTEDSETDARTVIRIYAIPGRAAGLLKDIRDASQSADKKEATNSASTKPKATESTSSAKTATPAAIKR